MPTKRITRIHSPDSVDDKFNQFYIYIKFFGLSEPTEILAFQKDPLEIPSPNLDI